MTKNGWNWFTILLGVMGLIVAPIVVTAAIPAVIFGFAAMFLLFGLLGGLEWVYDRIAERLRK